jgi:hypothetical protein
MRVKRILVYVNKALTVLTGSLLFLLISVSIFPFTRKKRRPIRIPLGVNVVVIAVILVIIAAYGGAFDKPKKENTAANTEVSSF